MDNEAFKWGTFLDEPTRIDADGAEVIPSDPVVTFLNRWIWRTENRAVVEKELRELIAEAKRD